MEHKLVRQVRFCVNPFLTETPVGANSFAAKPCGEGLALYLSLWVELVGAINPNTGFLINVALIDKPVRQKVIPLFEHAIREHYQGGRHISLSKLAGLLNESAVLLKGQFEELVLSSLRLELTPNRHISINMEDSDVVYLSEKFEFAAMHMLWNEDFSAEDNFRIFGKCANENGHGHNYVIEVTIRMSSNRQELSIGQFEQVVEDRFLSLVDHRNLNEDVDHFHNANPTVENIADFAFSCLRGSFGEAHLDRVTVWENAKTYCTVGSEKT